MKKAPAEKYRPSNGDEGDWFMSKFCWNCARGNLEEGAEGLPCGILGRALGYGIDDDEYPKEWIEDEHGKRCTAFIQEGEEVPYRCESTMDMFGNDNDQP